MTIRDKDRGFRKVVKALLDAGRKPLVVTVGIHAAEGGQAHKPPKRKKPIKGEHAQALTIGAIAEKNEFGRGVRARSFVVAYAEAAKADIEAQERNLARGVAKGKIGRKQYGELFGLFAVGGMQKRISDGIPPPNEKSTILRKGSSVPLIDTGQLRSSIRHKVKQ